MQSPNVVMIVADDMGYGDLGCFGNPVVKTPHLDALAQQGIALRQHYSASGLCAPARASLLTGRYNHRTGAVDVPSNRGLDRLQPGERTLADMFRASGYATTMVGKWHNGLHDLRYHPNAYGFDNFYGFLNGGMDYYRWVLDRNGTPVASDGRYLTDVFTEAGCEFIQANTRKPFFLYLAYNAPHLPLQAPEERVRYYREHGDLTEEVATLYAMIEEMDAGIGRVLETLNKTGVADNTIVLFTSDNGPYLAGNLNRYNGPFRGAKGDSLEGGIRVPMLLRWPDGLSRGQQSDSLVHFCDWLPTLRTLCGCTWAPTFALDGWDQSATLRGEAGELPTTRYWQRNRYEPVPFSNAAIRDGEWKLVWPQREGADVKDSSDQEDYEQGLTGAHQLQPIRGDLPQQTLGPVLTPHLYHIPTDPWEANDLAHTQPDRVAKMTHQWEDWFTTIHRDWSSARASMLRQTTLFPAI